MGVDRHLRASLSQCGERLRAQVGRVKVTLRRGAEAKHLPGSRLVAHDHLIQPNQPHRSRAGGRGTRANTTSRVLGSRLWMRPTASGPGAGSRARFAGTQGTPHPAVAPQRRAALTSTSRAGRPRGLGDTRSKFHPCDRASTAPNSCQARLRRTGAGARCSAHWPGIRRRSSDLLRGNKPTLVERSHGMV